MSTCTCKPEPSVAELAAADQAAARERNFERRAQRIAGWILVAGMAAGGYSLFAISGDVPAPSWAPISQSVNDEPLTPAPVEIPEGYEPAVPAEPVTPEQPRYDV